MIRCRAALLLVGLLNATTGICADAHSFKSRIESSSAGKADGTP